MTSTSGMREALEAAKEALTKIRARSIAGAEYGYGQPDKWAEALFTSHGDVHAALKQIDAALSAVPAPLSDMENCVANSAANQAESAHQPSKRLLLATVPPEETEAADVQFVLDGLQTLKDEANKRKFIASFRKQIWSVAVHHGWDEAVFVMGVSNRIARAIRSLNSQTSAEKD